MCSKICYLVTACCFLFICSNGQVATLPPIPLQANKIVYYDSVFLDTTYSVASLFENAQNWYTHNFESSDNRLTIDNKEAGIISGSGIANFKKHKSDYKDLLFVVDIVVGKGYYVYKFYNLQGYDNGLKFEYSDMYHQQLYPIAKPQWPRETRENKLLNMDITIKDIISDLSVSMKKRTDSKR